MNKIFLTLKAVRQLGLAQTSLNALYRFGLWSGHYRRSTPSPTPESVSVDAPLEIAPAFVAALCDLYPLAPGEAAHLLDQAAEICTGKVRLFGGDPVPLELAPGSSSGAASLAHWTEYELGRVPLQNGKDDTEDVKFTWEPARFCWAYPLARAYTIARNEDYAQFFWRSYELFQSSNPPYFGPNWRSGQEVALRLAAFIFAAGAFSPSAHSTPERMRSIAQAVADHARRIPLTLVYARSQNNNHLLSEAAGLYTAGLMLPTHPQSAQWRTLGWKWFNQGLQSQIAGDGGYVQHSTNYHRLALQLALWVAALEKQTGGQSFPAATLARLEAAACWLQRLVDPQSGRAPNLGANDGAHIMPLTPAPYYDYRPVVKAAIKIWAPEYGEPEVEQQEPGELTPNLASETQIEIRGPHKSKFDYRFPVLESQDRNSHLRAFFNIACYTARPSHADQLQVDIWWSGINLALDAGTYRYHAAAPWNNSLSTTAIHNTMMVDNQEQMTHAGRFLWLDWAQARLVGREDEPQRLVASHDGYLRLGVTHRRSLELLSADSLVVRDDLLAAGSPVPFRQHSARLHWLLPDLPWSLEGKVLTISTSRGKVSLEINGCKNLSLARAGELLTGPGPVLPVSGWHSPTYGQKVPSLALIATSAGDLPLSISTTWRFGI